MLEKLCGIYCITNLVNGKKLIGQSNNIRVRWNSHRAELRKQKHKNQHFQNAFNEYGLDNFKFEIVLLCSVEDLDKEEIRLIKENKTTDKTLGYNLTEGGSRPIFTKEAIDKMKAYQNNRTPEHHKNLSLGQTGENNHFFGKQLTDEHKEKISEALSGENHPLFGTHRSDETKKKIADKHLGIKLSEEHKKKIGDSERGEKHFNYGKHWSEETKQKISESLSGDKHPCFGKHPSEHTRQRRSESMKRAWALKKAHPVVNPSLTVPPCVELSYKPVSHPL